MTSRNLSRAKKRRRTEKHNDDSDIEFVYSDAETKSSYYESDSSRSISSLSDTTSWTTSCEMKSIPFTKRNQFHGKLGTAPIDYFNYFIDEKLLKTICMETNAEAERLHMSDGVTEESRINAWKEITVPELKIFIGLLFHMGTVQLTRIQDYWKTDRLFTIPVFRENMSRNRFLIIMKCLCFTSEADSEDILSKIRVIINYFNSKMNVCYYPGKDLTLDDSIVLWKGRLKFRQLMKNKQHNGLKIYALTEPDGIMIKLYAHSTTKEKGISGKGTSKKELAEKIVFNLLEEKIQNGHAVYLDENYSSFDLARQLLDNGTYCTGLLNKKTTEQPMEVVKKKLCTGENVSLFREGVHIGKWRNKSSLIYITTEFENKMISVTNKRGQVTQKPKAIVKYFESADLNGQDQIFSFYPCERITLRWHVKIAVHVFHLLLINSHKIYNRFSSQRNVSFYNYRLCVINALLPIKRNIAKASRRREKAEATHKISKITERNAKGKIKRKSCRWCTKNKKRKDSVWHCITCTEKPGLCVECFEDYHNAGFN